MDQGEVRAWRENDFDNERVMTYGDNWDVFFNDRDFIILKFRGSML